MNMTSDEQLNIILEMCVSGISNEKIAYKFNIPIRYIKAVLTSLLGWEGWLYDLDISPWDVYRACGGSFAHYMTGIRALTKLIDGGTLQLTYKLCKRYDDIRKELDL